MLQMHSHSGVDDRESMHEPVGSARDLLVRLGAFTLGPLSLELRRSEILCLLGPNGAGKTTLLRALLGLVPLSGGDVRLVGHHPRDREPAFLRAVGRVSDDPGDVVEELTARELWELHAYAHARVHGEVGDMLARAEQLAARLDFTPPDAPIHGYSHGMTKKTQTVAAMLHRPAILAIDEPRNGLDPIGIERLEGLLRHEADAGASVITASHDLRWAERFADRVCVLSRGQIVAAGRPADVMEPTDDDFAAAFFRLLEETAP